MKQGRKLVDVKSLILVVCGVFLYAGCQKHVSKVFATAETNPVERADEAANDLAIYASPKEGQHSFILGANTQKGIDIYLLSGERVRHYDFGRMNNIDLRMVRSDFVIVGASNRSTNSLDIFRFMPETATILPLLSIPSRITEVYGVTFFFSGTSLFAYLSGMNGTVEQYRIHYQSSPVTATLIASRSFSSVCVGMVADDVSGDLYIGQEELGVWKLPADNLNQSPDLVIDLQSFRQIKSDIGGLTIYQKTRSSGYLILSSQGNNSFAVFDREEPHKYLGRFQIHEAQFGAAEQTSGIDVTHKAVGDNFPDGLFMAQDGKNEPENQNFKLIPWHHIQEAINTWEK